ncbi:stage II sporulation protein P [Sporosarcina koreensis]|uniref:stage II sporulation protein P n=1 Tax=Bacillales TaxID=1385 RepID=UPI000755BDEA|nr:stage II sporulation protein P [Sporosarcina koreensis]
MKKNLQIWTAIVFVLFLFPVLIQFIPEESKISTSKIVKENALIVYASNIVAEDEAVPETAIESETEAETETENEESKLGKVLLYNTHSTEAYKPITKAVDGKLAVDQHQTENVVKMSDKLKSLLEINGVETDTLKKKVSYSRAYKDIRPFVQKQLAENEYDLIIDIHRDSAGPEATTIGYKGERYAKVAFVLGQNNPSYKKNEAITNKFKSEMEKRIPGIMRNVISKGGAGVDGKYNQDLHPNLVLMELGGVGNSEEELNRTLIVISEVIMEMLANDEIEEK